MERTTIPDEHRLWLEENYSRMYAFALSQLHARADAEDAVCDTAVCVIAKYDTLADKSRFPAWAWGILRNIILRAGRRQARRLREDDIDDYAETAADHEILPPAENLVLAEERGQVRKILAMLPENTRKVLEERYIREKSYAEIADELEIPLSGVTWRIHEGKKQMRKEWDLMELDTYMKDGYYTPADLKIDIRWRKKAEISDLRMESIRAKYSAMGGLLAKNVAIVCYDSPKTVTDVSRIMGVPAVYIEEILAKLLENDLMKQTANRYQTAFPILGGKLYDQIKKLSVEKCLPLYEKWTDALMKAAYSVTFSAAVNEVTLTAEEKAYILFFAKGNFGHDDPFSDDGSLPYPHENREASWCVKAYAEKVDPEEIFPITHFFCDCANTAGERVELHFDGSHDWFRYQEAEELDTLLSKVRSGEIRALLFEGREDFLSEITAVREIGAMQYDDQLRLKDELVKAALTLLPERFRAFEAYVNCEIRNFILAGWEEYLLKKHYIKPAAAIVHHKKEADHTVSDSSAVMY